MDVVSEQGFCGVLGLPRANVHRFFMAHSVSSTDTVIDCGSWGWGCERREGEGKDRSVRVEECFLVCQGFEGGFGTWILMESETNRTTAIMLPTIRRWRGIPFMRACRRVKSRYLR